MLGVADYDPLLNNCEHFACYCKAGIKQSRQVRKLIKPAAAGAVVASAGMFALSRALRGQRPPGKA